MDRTVDVSRIGDPEVELLRRRVKQLEAELQSLRSETAAWALRDPNGSDIFTGLNILQAIEDGLVVFDAKWRFVLCNRNAELLLRRSSGELNGKTLWDELPELLGTPTESALRRAMKERVIETSELYFPPLAGWFQGRIYPTPSGGLFALFRNVTEQKMAEAALQRSEERWRNLANALPQFVWVALSYGNVQFVNQSWYQYTGLPEGGLDYGGILAAVHPEDRKIIEDMWQEAIADGCEKTFDYRVKRAADATYRWHRGFHRPERDSQGTIIRWIGCGFEIHDLREAQEKLSAMTERQTLAIDAGGVALWDWELSSDKVNWSEQLYAIHGLTPGSFEGTLQAFIKLVHVEDAERIRAAIQEAAHTGELQTSEFRVVRPNSEIRWVSMRARVIRDESGRPARLLGASIDITERKTIENRLSKQVMEFETLFRELPVGVGVAYDRRCDVIRINPAFAAMLGIPADSNGSKNVPNGDHLRFRVMQGDKEIAPEDLPMQVAARTGCEVRNFRYELERPDGSRLAEYGNAVPLIDENGNVTGSIGVFVDIQNLPPTN